MRTQVRVVLKYFDNGVTDVQLVTHLAEHKLHMRKKQALVNTVLHRKLLEEQIAKLEDSMAVVSIRQS